MSRTPTGSAAPNRRPARSWWGGNADRGDSVRLEAFSDGVLAIAITLLILDVRVEQQPGQSLAAALGHAGPEIGAYAASFLQIGIMWANHHALFRIVARVDQVLLLANLLLLGFVAFLPLPPAWSPNTPPAPTPAPRCCSTAPPSPAAPSRST